MRTSRDYCYVAMLSLWAFPRTPLGGWTIKTQNDSPGAPPNSHQNRRRGWKCSNANGEAGEG